MSISLSINVSQYDVIFFLKIFLKKYRGGLTSRFRGEASRTLWTTQQRTATQQQHNNTTTINHTMNHAPLSDVAKVAQVALD